MRKCKTKRSFENVEINGTVYEIKLSDKDLKRYKKALTDYYLQVDKLHLIDTETISANEQTEIFDTAKSLLKSKIDLILGDGSFEKIYKESGGDIFTTIDLLSFLTEVIGEKLNEKSEETAQKHLRKKDHNKPNRNS